MGLGLRLRVRVRVRARVRFRVIRIRVPVSTFGVAFLRHFGAKEKGKPGDSNVVFVSPLGNGPLQTHFADPTPRS